MNYKDNNNTNSINNFLTEKIIISNKNYYCSNCNKRGHTYNKCYEPIISNGIISIHIDDFDVSLIAELEKYIFNNIKKNINNIDNNNIYHKKIKFLMVQRKHSLGYMEFMRGKYNINNINEIIHLIQQMTPSELNNIINNNFDYLWNMLWDNDPFSATINKKKQHYKEYIMSKQKFYELKMNNNDIFLNTKPIYTFNEWGFPKGRREMYETDLVCAMREFEEETNYKENEYQILNETNIIKENLTGTNGINYRHNYFLAFIFKNNIHIKENKEIADIKFMNIDNCISVIRPYHINKQSIIKKLHNIITNFMLEKHL
jgi:ADP-ribose pyrophosphatase YjhB (NUDIX family)